MSRPALSQVLAWSRTPEPANDLWGFSGLAPYVVLIQARSVFELEAEHVKRISKELLKVKDKMVFNGRFVVLMTGRLSCCQAQG